MAPKPGTAVKPSADGDAGGAAPAPAKPMGAWQKVGVGAAAGGLGFAGIFGAIMVFPKAVGDTIFPFLPEEMRPFASCCSYCLSIVAALALVVMMMVRR